MRIVLNLLPLKTGGGVQVALDFIAHAKVHGVAINWKIVCRTNMPFIPAAGGNVEVSHVVKDSLATRLYFEYIGCRAYLADVRPDAVFTLFGPQWPGATVVNIVGCAYSNLFYPEIDFWRGLPWHKRLLKKIVDWQRMHRLDAADIRIFETLDLARRAIRQRNYLAQAVHVAPPACSSLVTPDLQHDATRLICESLPAGFKVLLLSGYHPNKNIELLVEAAAQLHIFGRKDVYFVLTLPLNNPGTQRVMAMAEAFGVAENVINIGPVPQQGCCELYRACDAAVLPSTLESFSNMIAESWAMKKPLLISDVDWARSLCSDAAIYFAHLNAKDLAKKLDDLASGVLPVQQFIENGSMQLSLYPTSRQRFENYLEIIESTVAPRNGKCIENT